MQANTMTGLTGIKTGDNTETSKLLTKILNTFYTSGIDRIKTYGKTPNGNIVGEFIADGSSFRYILNMKTNTVSYEPVGSKTANKADSLLAEQENADRFKAIYSVHEAFEVSSASAIEQKLDSWFFRADAVAKVKVGVKTAANKSGKTLTCTPGKTFPCGAVCRAMGKPCKQPMSPEVQEMAKQVATKIATPTAVTTATTKPAVATSPTSAKSGKITAQQMAEQIAAAKALEPNRPKEKSGTNRLTPLLINSKRVNGLTEEFDEKDLREAAEAFIKLGGFIESPVVRRKGEGANISYDLVSGAFQVATAMVAKAMYPEIWDTFPAMVIEAEYEEAIAQQIKATRKTTANDKSNPDKKYSQKQIEEIAKQLKGGKPNLTPVYVRSLKPRETFLDQTQGVYSTKEFASDENPIGHMFRGVSSFIKGDGDKPDAKYEYEVVTNGNGHILEASRLAKNDFISIVLLDDKTEKQLKAEAGK